MDAAQRAIDEIHPRYRVITECREEGAMRILFALLCALTAIPAMGATNAEEHERLCDTTLGKGKRMIPFHDARLRGYAEEFLRRTDMRGAPIILCVTDRAGAGAWTDVVETGGGRALVIGVGRRFARDLGVHMRAIIAHEVGHVVQGDLNHCIRRRGSLESCEFEVDRIAISWVGKPAMISSLREALRQNEWEGTHQSISYSGIGELIHRLRILEATP